MINVEIKNLKVAEFASEETLCYEATIYVDGVRAILARNDGHGGADYYNATGISDAAKDAFRVAMDKIAAHVKTLPPMDMSAYGSEPLAMDMEMFISGLVADIQLVKSIKRNFGKKLCFKTPQHEDGAYGYFSVKSKALFAKTREHCLAKYPEAIILNDLDGQALIDAVGTAA